jgi:hypothetical protein
MTPSRHDLDLDPTLADDADAPLVVPERRHAPPANGALHRAATSAAREREYLMPLYGAYQGRKLDTLVAAPFVEAGWLTPGRRRDWLTDAGKDALRKARFEL